ncbi:MAG: glycosyltransferase [Candidatus Latescibacteria bacterium]|nr:glycosyltransferase [bacterium]MBD3424292.1 glycosyltransferase [Candidatus Latescibacterota bacterium]
MEKREAILAVLPGDRLGGAEQYLKNLAVHFSRGGLSVHVIFMTRKRFRDWEDLPENIHLYFARAGSAKWGLFYITRIIHRISREYRVRYAFASNTHINSFLGLLRFARILKTVRLVVRESTTILTRFSGLKRLLFVMHYRMGYRFTDLVICQTGRMRDELHRYLPLSRNWNVRVIQNPVDLEHINRMANREIPPEVEEAGDFIAGAGRLIGIKGFHILIDAFSRIATEYPSLKLVILGEGDQRENLEAEADRLGLSGRVILPGHSDNPLVWFRKARLCAVSSLVEGFPNVLLQMMSQCDRVVSTTCAGEIDRIEGILTCPPGDPETLAEQIARSVNAEDLPRRREAFDAFLQKNTVSEFVARIDRLC